MPHDDIAHVGRTNATLRFLGAGAAAGASEGAAAAAAEAGAAAGPAANSSRYSPTCAHAVCVAASVTRRMQWSYDPF